MEALAEHQRDESPDRRRWFERKYKCTICRYRALQIPTRQELPAVKFNKPSTRCRVCHLGFCDDCLKECFSHDEESMRRRTGERIQYYECELCEQEWCLSAMSMKIGGGLRNAIESLSIPTPHICWSENNDGRPICSIPGCKAIFCSSACLNEHSGSCQKCGKVKHMGTCVVCREAPLHVCRECEGPTFCNECGSLPDLD